MSKDPRVLFVLKILFWITVIVFVWTPSLREFSLISYVVIILGAIGFIVFHIDLYFLNSFRENLFPRVVVPSDYRPDISWSEYFVTCGINIYYPFYGCMGKLRLSETHLTVSLMTSMKGLALCHEPLSTISSVKIVKYMFSERIDVIFNEESSLNHLSLYLRNPKKWLSRFEDAGIAISIE